MNITFIPNRSIMLVTSDFRVLTATKDNPNWHLMEDAIKVGDEQSLINLISTKDAVRNFGNTNKIEIVGNNVFFAGQKLFGEDVNRILSYLSGGFPRLSMVKFLESKLRNVSPVSVASLYNFLENKEMPLTDNGTILGFKGVSNEYNSIHKGNEPLISGTRNSDGTIQNNIGDVVWMERRYVCDNNENACAGGLHIGSRSYAKGWGPKVVIVEFSAEHVVSVPDHEHSKLRVNKYRVVGELNTTDYLGEVYNSNYARPDETPEPDAIEEAIINGNIEKMFTSPKINGSNVSLSTDSKVSSKSIYNISDWSKGQSTGFGDGKSHQKRKFYECDKNTAFKKFSKEFVAGYLVGYKDGRASN